MERLAFWQPWDAIGLEQLRLVDDERGALADSLLICLMDGRPLRLHYEIRIDTTWSVREVTIEQWAPEYQQLMLRSDGAGHWTDAAGDALDQLDGCRDIDLNATPFTNTLPIRRLKLAPGEARELSVAYIQAPELSVCPVRQRYTRLERGSDGERYRYEGLETGFVAELPVDADGVVRDYPGIWQRLPLT